MPNAQNQIVPMMGGMRMAGRVGAGGGRPDQQPPGQGMYG